ncbi:imidazolonepropionase-like domain-containing protein [Streptomyces sp. GC420]|uniref:amidohydrolase family protein n=1 Tax=Streptomyces sp. GC420 TaxID=2697568 RepID=UPI001414F67A|nr:hypothetical protein [Streptomyces sp. GC420]NBM15430.1 hypothetical protein [Streptomyces sp. GC420]
MTTLHTAALLLPGAGHAPVPDGAVAVDGGRIAAVGAFDEVAAARPGARVRRWPGILTPGLVNPFGSELLEHTYHPDPREAAGLGTEPITGEALAALPMDPARWGASARRGLQRMLAHGTTAVAGAFRLRPVCEAVARSGLTQVQRFTLPEGPPQGPPSLDPLRFLPPAEAFVAEPLTQLQRAATFTVFDVPVDGDPYEALAGHGARTCVATVLDGRLLYRRR